MIKSWIKHWPLLLALGIGLVFRSYQSVERFNYSHDSDLASWIVKDIVIDKHVRLIGQLTSSPGIFIGPLFYYLQIPFYLLGNMDPHLALILPVLIGLGSIVSVYYVFTKLYGRLPGVFGSLLYAGSWGISATEREVVPTTPVFLWSIWFLYACNLIVKGDKKGLIVVAILWGLVWHINLALIFSVPLFLGLVIWQKSKFKIQDFVLPLVLVVVMSLPLIAFEVKHNFGQIRSIVNSVGSSSASGEWFKKTEKVGLYLSKNANGIFWQKPDQINYYLLPGILLLSCLYLWKAKSLSTSHFTILLAWFGLYVVEFTFYPINLSEYYLNGASILWIVIGALVLSRFKQIGVLLLGVFLIHNLALMINYPVDHSGYLQKKALAAFITEDAKLHNYPCVAISYMTDPGRDLGYRYWYYLNNLHVNQPNSGSPVYTVVFPHTRAGRLDKSFGSIGLVLPDYDRYTSQDIDKSCSGQNANLTDPMFGFTK